MADNVVVTAGTGTTIHSDEYTHTTLGSGKTQLVKLVDGTLDSSTAIASGSGTATNALRVELPTNGTGMVGLNAGTNAIGKLAANSGVDIGDVDVTSSALPTGASTLAEQQTQTTSLQKIDNIAHSGSDVALSEHVPISGQFDDVGTTTVTENQVAPLRITSGRALHVQAQANSGVDIGDVTINNATIAVTQSGTWDEVGINDSGNSITVDNGGTFATQSTLQAGTAYAGKVRLTDGTTDTDIRDLTNSNALNVAIVDGAGDQITSFGGGTQYTEDAAAAANPVGTSVNLVRQDTPAALVTTDGDNVTQRGTNYGAAFTQIVTSGGAFVDTFGGGTQYDEDTVSGAADKITMAGVVRKDTWATLVDTDGDRTQLQVDNLGALRVNIADDTSGYLSAIDTSLNNIESTSSTSNGFLSNISGWSVNLSVREDDASTNQGYGLPALATRRATPANTSGTDGDYEFLQMSAGRLWTSAVIDTALPAGTNNIGDVDILSISAGDNNIGNVDIVTLPTIPSGTNYIGKVRLTDGTTDTDIRDLANSNALNVSIVDGSGDQITSFGGGTQYTEDAAAAANPVGTAVNLVRQDTPAALVTTDGDNVAQRGTNYGAAYTQIVTSGGAFVDSFGGGTQYTEGDTDATITGTAMMMEGAGNALVAAPGTAADGLTVNLGTNNDVTVTGTVTANAGTNLNTSLLALESGGNLATIAGDTTSIQTAVELIDDIVYTDDTSTHSTGTSKGALIMAAATPTDTAVNANDIGAVGMTNNRAMYVSVQDAIPTGTNNIGDVDVASIAAGDNNIGNVDVVTMPNVTLAAGTNTNEVVGDIAHDTGVSGNPVLIAGAAQAHDDTAPPNRVSAESDTTRLATDFDGSLFVRPHGPQVWTYHVNGSSALTDASVHAAPGAGLSLYVGTIVFSSGAATAINMFLEEGASTVIGPYYLEATNGRGMAVQFNPPRKITANTALTITTSAAIAHSVDITGFTAQG